ncbi:hypothetical protein IAU59_004868 [Kwoniella sp. CBS 9459]
MSIDINWSLLSQPEPESDFTTSAPGPSSSHRQTFQSSDPALTPPASGSASGSTTEPSPAPEDALATSLIQILNAQLSSAKRPSFIGPVTVTSFSFGSNGPDLEIKDIRDVWRVFDEGDEEGDFEIEEAEARRLEEEALEREQEELRSGLDGERYELVSPISPHANGYRGDVYGMSADGDMDVDDEVSHVEDDLLDRSYHRSSARAWIPMPKPMPSGRRRGGSYVGGHAHTNSIFHNPAGPSTPARGIARSTSNPIGMSSNLGGGRSFVPFHLDPTQNSGNSSSAGMHVPPTPGLFSPRLGMGMGIGMGMGMGGSQVGLHTGETPSQRAGPTRSRAGSVASMPIPSSAAALNALHHNHGGGPAVHRSSMSRTQSQARGGPRHSLDHGHAQGNLTETRDTTQLSPPPSPPAHPSGLPRPSTSSSSIPSLQLHLHLSHTSDLNLTLLTSLQVNYPSKLFMALPLKLSITGFQLEGEIVMAYSGDKHRVHLTILDDISTSSASNSNPNAAAGTHSSTHALPNLNPAATGEDRRNLPIGQRLLPSLQIESEIGHADAHVLRNVGKVERFIVDVIRKTLVEELVFPNFHTIAL